MDKVTILTKVGNKALSRFRNAKVYRAITVAELSSLATTFSRHFTVIENVNEKEYDALVTFVKADIESGNKVYIFSPDNDDTTTGLADELDLNIYFDINDIYTDIANATCVNVDIDIVKNKSIVSYADDGGDADFNSQFADAIEVAEAVNFTGKTLTEDTLEIKSIFDAEKDPFIIDARFRGEAVEDNENTEHEQPATVEEEAGQAVESTVETPVTVVEKVVDNEEVDRLTALLNSSREKISELSKSIKAIKDERDTYSSELAAIETADIITDPDTINSVNEYKARIAELEAEITEKSNSSDADIKQQLAEIEELKEKVTEYEDRIAELQIRNAGLENKLTEALDNSEKDSEIEKLSEKVRSLTDQVDALEAENSKLSDENRHSAGDIAAKAAQIVAVTATVAHLKDLLQTAANKMLEITALKAELETLKLASAGKDGTIAKLSSDLAEREARISKLSSDTERRIELAQNYAETELNKVKSDNVALSSQIRLLSSQLEAKTAQYQNLLQSAGIDENGASALLENKKALELVNADLRQQLIERGTEITKLSADRTELQKSVDGLSEINSRLKLRLKSMTSGMSGGFGNGVVSPINYTGRAQVITVTGSGSYGITTTAFSLATILSSQGKVLFIDFDLLSAKADRYFSMNPMLSGMPDTMLNDRRNSGLGLTIEKGVDYFTRFGPNLIIHYNRTKGGLLDYMSGFYAKPDLIKLVSADYTNFFNYCGNSYDYIVVDSGRFGASDVNDQILKVIASISRGVVVVTTPDKLEIRNTSMYLSDSGIINLNVSWLINLAESTKLDEKAKKKIGGNQYMIMPMLDGFYGQNKPFIEARVARDRITKFLNEMILSR